MLKTLTFIRHNAIALLALFVALGGTSYAAFSLPAGSVGTKQLRNGAVTSKKIGNGTVTPAKLNAASIGGSVRHWAFVNQDGSVIGGSRGTHVSLGPNGAPYYVSWGDRFSHSCAVLANSPGTEGNAPIADSHRHTCQRSNYAPRFDSCVGVALQQRDVRKRPVLHSRDLLTGSCGGGSH